MTEMRRSDRGVTDPAQLEEILQSCKVFRLALATGEAPYIVPLNFGYTWKNEKLVLYFHGAAAGRKMALMQKSPQVGFEMDCNHQLMGEGTEGCRYSYRYSSIIGAGTVSLLETTDDKRLGLECIMKHQTGREGFQYDPGLLERTAVFRLVAEWFSGKARELG